MAMEYIENLMERLYILNGKKVCVKATDLCYIMTAQFTMVNSKMARKTVMESLHFSIVLNSKAHLFKEEFKAKACTEMHKQESF
jgi:hypothetical protein